MHRQWDDVYRWFQVLGVLPVCVLGVVGNSVSLWAWRLSQKSSAVVVLFQCLGFVDNFYLVIAAVSCALRYLDDPRPARPIAIPLFFLKALSVHVTLVIAVCRWMTVTKPLLMQRVKPRHVLLTCGGLVLWCGLLVTPVIVSVAMEELFAIEYLWLMHIVLPVMALVLPSAVLVGFSVSLLQVTFRLQRQPRNIRRMTTAVLMISGCSVLACAMEVGWRVLVAFSPVYGRDGCNWACFFMMNAFSYLLHALNSSVNFFFYFFLASRFRPLLRQSFSRCLPRRQPTDRQQPAEQPPVDLVECRENRPQDRLPESNTAV